jgi:hypothetical protein
VFSVKQPWLKLLALSVVAMLLWASGGIQAAYNLIEGNGTPATRRQTLNFVSGTNTTATVSDVAGVTTVEYDASEGAGNPTISITNAGSTGTTTSTLTKLTGAPSTAVIAATTDTGGIVGITTAGAGTSSSATITIAGQVNCVFDAGTTAGDYVQISSMTAGNCHDTGAGTYPTSGQVIGRVLSTHAGAGTYQIDLFPSEIKAATSGGGGVSLPQIGVGLTSLNDPNGFTYTWFNQASSTITSNGASLVLATPNSGGNNLSGRTTPVTGSSPYTLTLGFVPNLINSASMQCGIVITDGSNYIVIRFRNDSAVDGWTWTGTGTPSTNIFTFGSVPAISASAIIFFQIQETSSNRLYRFSTDGVNFQQLYSETDKTFLTATRGGFFCLNSTLSTYTAAMTAVHLTLSAP